MSSEYMYSFGAARWQASIRRDDLDITERNIKRYEWHWGCLALRIYYRVHESFRSYRCRGPVWSKAVVIASINREQRPDVQVRSQGRSVTALAVIYFGVSSGVWFWLIIAVSDAIQEHRFIASLLPYAPLNQTQRALSMFKYPILGRRIGPRKYLNQPLVGSINWRECWTYIWV